MFAQRACKMKTLLVLHPISRLREEKLRLEREKQRERMKKCMQRSLGDSKKIVSL